LPNAIRDARAYGAGGVAVGQPEAEVVDVAGELGRFEDVEVEIAVDEPSGGPVEVVGAHGEQATVLVLGADGADGGVDPRDSTRTQTRLW
jgi:hypothetical protein